MTTNASSLLPKPETISSWLQKATKSLKTVGISTARLDALILLEDSLDKDRSYLLAHPEITVQGPTLYKLNQQIRQRAKHQPLAYIRGKTEFYGREFVLNKHVLEPRPESETMIDQMKALHKEGPCTVIDVGTGSGAIAITAKLELPDANIHAIDIDPKCLIVARKNAKRYGSKIHFHKGDLLEPLLTTTPLYSGSQYTIILANLPYVPDHYQINDAAMMEPRIAIFGGKDGLDLYRKLFKQLDKFPAQYVLTESLPFQHSDLQKIAKSHGYTQIESQDFIQVFVSRFRSQG